MIPRSSLWTKKLLWTVAAPGCAGYSKGLFSGAFLPNKSLEVENRNFAQSTRSERLRNGIKAPGRQPRSRRNDPAIFIELRVAGLRRPPAASAGARRNERAVGACRSILQTVPHFASGLLLAAAQSWTRHFL